MKAQVLRQTAPIDSRPLALVEMPTPEPKAGEILVRVSACGVCHTELDEIEGRLQPKLPVIWGPEIIGRV
jgi:propanol-preferring alcohol dehydrogenase